MNTKLSGAFALIFFFFFLSACQSYKKVPYLQDAEILKQANTQVAPVQDARLIPGDEVSILVSTSDPVVSQPFNAQGSTFLLDDQGNINYPVLGKLPLNGLTSREAENLITERLKAYVKERPTVVVRMSGFKVSVLGEVASPGVYPVVNEQINVLEALAMAGDLGGSIGPGIVGRITQNAGNNIRIGMGFGLIFPVILLFMLFLLYRKKSTQPQISKH